MDYWISVEFIAPRKSKENRSRCFPINSLSIGTADLGMLGKGSQRVDK